MSVSNLKGGDSDICQASPDTNNLPCQNKLQGEVSHLLPPWQAQLWMQQSEMSTHIRSATQKKILLWKQNHFLNKLEDVRMNYLLWSFEDKILQIIG